MKTTLRSKTNGVDRIGDCDLPVNRQVVSEGHGKKGVSNHVRMRGVTLILFCFKSLFFVCYKAIILNFYIYIINMNRRRDCIKSNIQLLTLS